MRVSIKRDIARLCRDASPHTVRGKHTEEPEDLPLPPPQQQDIKPTIPTTSSTSTSTSQLPPQLYSDPNFPPAWPLLPDTDQNTGATFVDGTVGNGLGLSKGGANDGQGWGMSDESELGALS